VDNPKKVSFLVALVSISGILAVLLGAMGSHFLKSRLSPASLDIYHTASLCHWIHTIVMLVLAVSLNSVPKPKWMWRASISMGIGIILFSGSLYILAITGIKTLGIIPPLGALFWIAGWAMLIPANLKS
jgi:uncharacterized membrane protein YgdD (TMEM256/DUF423 family)